VRVVIRRAVSYSFDRLNRQVKVDARDASMRLTLRDPSTSTPLVPWRAS
jgi:hypothetical protein